jgi:hypothetical protein
MPCRLLVFELLSVDPLCHSTLPPSSSLMNMTITVSTRDTMTRFIGASLRIYWLLDQGNWSQPVSWLQLTWQAQDISVQFSPEWIPRRCKVYCKATWRYSRWIFVARIDAERNRREEGSLRRRILSFSCTYIFLRYSKPWLKEQHYVRTRAGSLIAEVVLKGITISGLLGMRQDFFC